MAGAVCLMTVSCTDDFPFADGDIPEGEGTLSATVTFSPHSAANLSTRTAGNKLNDIRSLCVLVYTSDGKLYKKYSSEASGDEKLTYTPGEYTVNRDEDHLDGNQAHTDETKTAKATFSLNNLSFGRYKIYAVANMSDLLTTYSEDVQTEEGLKNISLSWNYKKIEENDQMFGYFTPADGMDADGFNGPLLIFNKPQTNIHAWLKRAASKVTVAFDPSGLRQGVRIYIRSVTIRDIPRECPLGAENRPTSVDQLYNNLETPFNKPNYEDKSPALPNTRFEYDREGIIMDTTNHTGDSKFDGFELMNKIRKAVPENAHATDAPSLFFYENNQQPDYGRMTQEEKKRYDKNQQHSGSPDGVGKPIRDDDGNNDFKDKVKYGTYIEVEAYYISSNPDNVGEGSIKYRFMLGKDTSYDYNAQRNYHYKLTLGFNGWANEPDWHIDYELPNPGIEVPEVFRVSYLYHQESYLPIRILGECKELKVEIIENNWAPYDPTSRNPWPVPNAYTADDPDPDYAFEWDYEAFRNKEYMGDDGVPKPYFGFLCLHLPDRNTTSVDMEYGAAANVALEKYYKDNHEGDRTFSASDLATIKDNIHQDGTTEDDNYDIKPVKDDNGELIPGQKTLMLPVWTRAKTLIKTSGFSGNNPYEGYQRMAKLRIRAWFPGYDEPFEKKVTVFQVKRLVNPKGVWRANGRTESFNVTLLEAVSANGRSDFQPFTSEGEWTAYIDGQTNDAGFTLSTNGQTQGYIENGVIHGYDGTTINFAINFGAQVGENESQCAIVKVLYHGNQCLHKILIRKGYEAPVTMGGKRWSSFSLYQVTTKNKTFDGFNEEYYAILTKNPLMLGSMFRRGKVTRGIFVWNNEQPELGPFDPPGNRKFKVGRRSESISGLASVPWDGENWNEQPWLEQTWSGIGFEDQRGTEKTMGTYYVGEQKYRVPTFEDYQRLTDQSEFGFGVFYGSSATEPAMTAEEAYGLIDPYNEGLFESKMGMRGVIVYNKENGDQLFFPMGKFGTGRRNNFIFTGDKAGELRYGDVDYPLTMEVNPKNLYRPIAYNTKISCGNIYWIDKYVATGEYGMEHPCFGWDMNYFNFDFNPYPANNYKDACPIKLILVDD